MIFNISKNIIEELEWLVTRTKKSNMDWLDKSKAGFILPFKLLMSGYGVFMNPLGKFLLISIPTFYFYSLFVSSLPKPAGIFALYMFPMFLAIPLLTTIFSVPSAYCYDGIKLPLIMKVVEKIKEVNLMDKGSIELIKRNIEIFEKRVTAKLIALRALVVLMYTGWTYLNTQITSKLAMQKSLHESDVFFWGMTFTIVGFLYLAIESYSRANSQIFKSALLGCNEAEHILFCINEEVSSEDKKRKFEAVPS